MEGLRALTPPRRHCDPRGGARPKDRRMPQASSMRCTRTGRIPLPLVPASGSASGAGERSPGRPRGGSALGEQRIQSAGQRFGTGQIRGRTRRREALPAALELLRRGLPIAPKAGQLGQVEVRDGDLEARVHPAERLERLAQAAAPAPRPRPRRGRSVRAPGARARSTTGSGAPRRGRARPRRPRGPPRSVRPSDRPRPGSRRTRRRGVGSETPPSTRPPAREPRWPGRGPPSRDG